VTDEPEATPLRPIRVVADARLKVTLLNFELPLMSGVLFVVAAALSYVLLQLPLSPPMKFAASLLMGTAGLVAGSQTREGVWIGVWWLYTRLNGLFPAAVVDGRPRRALLSIQAVPDRDGEAPAASAESRSLDVVQLRGTRAELPGLPGFLQPLVSLPQVVDLKDGIARLAGVGYVAILRYDGPVAALGGRGYQDWCDTALRAWVPAIKAPVQFVTLVEHMDRAQAEQAFDTYVERGAMVATKDDGVGSARAQVRRELVQLERRAAGAQAEFSVCFTHYLVVAPGAADRSGRPYGSFLHRAHLRRECGEKEARGFLSVAVRTAAQVGITTAVPDVQEIRRLYSRTVLGASSAATSRAGTLVDDAWRRTVVVQNLGSEAESGCVAAALLAARTEAIASVHYHPGDPDVARRRIRRRIAALKAAQRQAHGSNQETTQAIEQQEMLERALINRLTQPATMAITVTLSASTRAELERATTALETELARGMRRTVRPTGPGFLHLVAATPGAAPLGRGVIEVTDDYAPCFLPAMGTPFSDARLPYYGRNLATDAPVYWSMFGGQNNSALVLGKSGSGKSVSTMTIAVREGYRGVRTRDDTVLPTTVVVIDHSGEWEAAMDLLGGRCVSLGHDSLNVFGLTLGADAREAAVLAAPTLAVMVGEETVSSDGAAPRVWLDRGGHSLLKTALLGFLERRVSVHAEPVLSDFVSFLLDSAAELRRDNARAALRYEEMAERLHDYVLPPYDVAFDRPSSFNLGDGLSTAIGVGELGDLAGGNLTAVYAMALMAFRRMLRSHAGRVVLIIDDAHPLLVNRIAAEILNDSIRECRKFDGAVVIGSQQAEDFLENPVGRVLAGNSDTKIIGALDPAVARAAAEAFGLSAEHLALLTQLTRRQAGTFVLSTPRASCPMRFMPGPMEPYFVGDANDPGGSAFRPGAISALNSDRPARA
jgi:hypothetical protein